MKTYRIEQAVALDDHRLRLRWTDGLEGVADLSALMTSPPFTVLRDPALFRAVRIADYGHTVFWNGPDGLELDLCPDRLRATVDPEVAAEIEREAHDWAQRPAAE